MVERPVIVFVSLALTEDKGENKKFKKRDADLVRGVEDTSLKRILWGLADLAASKREGNGDLEM